MFRAAFREYNFSSIIDAAMIIYLDLENEKQIPFVGIENWNKIDIAFLIPNLPPDPYYLHSVYNGSEASLINYQPIMFLSNDSYDFSFYFQDQFPVDISLFIDFIEIIPKTWTEKYDN